MLRNHQLAPGDIASIGISCGGPLDSKNGVVMSPPNLPGWNDVYIVKFLEDAFFNPCNFTE